MPITFLDTYEELEHWQPFAYSSAPNYGGSPGYSVSTFSEVCRLCIILNGVLNQVYNARGEGDRSKQLLQDLETLERDLNAWSEALPEHLKIASEPGAPSVATPPPHVLSLA